MAMASPPILEMTPPVLVTCALRGSTMTTAVAEYLLKMKSDATKLRAATPAATARIGSVFLRRKSQTALGSTIA